MLHIRISIPTERSSSVIVVHCRRWTLIKSPTFCGQCAHATQLRLSTPTAAAAAAETCAIPGHGETNIHSESIREARRETRTHRTIVHSGAYFTLAQARTHLKYTHTHIVRVCVYYAEVRKFCADALSAARHIT